MVTHRLTKQIVFVFLVFLSVACKPKHSLNYGREAHLFEESVFLTAYEDLSQVSNSYAIFKCSHFDGLCSRWTSLEQVYFFVEGNGIYMLCYYEKDGSLTHRSYVGLSDTSYSCESSKEMASKGRKVLMDSPKLRSVEELNRYLNIK